MRFSIDGLSSRLALYKRAQETSQQRVGKFQCSVEPLLHGGEISSSRELHRIGTALAGHPVFSEAGWAGEALSNSRDQLLVSM